MLEHLPCNVFANLVNYFLAPKEVLCLSLTCRQIYSYLRPYLVLARFAQLRDVSVRLNVPGQNVVCAAISGDGSIVAVVSTGQRGTTLLSFVETSTRRIRTVGLAQDALDFDHISLSETGRITALGGRGRRVYICHLTQLHGFISSFIDGELTMLQCSSSGRYVAAAISRESSQQQNHADERRVETFHNLSNSIVIFSSQGVCLRVIDHADSPSQDWTTTFGWGDDLFVLCSSMSGSTFRRYRAPNFVRSDRDGQDSSRESQINAELRQWSLVSVDALAESGDSRIALLSCEQGQMYVIDLKLGTLTPHWSLPDSRSRNREEWQPQVTWTKERRPQFLKDNKLYTIADLNDMHECSDYEFHESLRGMKHVLSHWGPWIVSYDQLSPTGSNEFLEIGFTEVVVSSFAATVQ